MEYSSHFISLLISLLLVQSDDSSSRYFDQKLLTTTNRPTFLSTFSPVRTKDRLSVLYSRALSKSLYSKSQTTTSTTSMYNLHHSNKRSIYDTTERPSIRWDRIDAYYRQMQLEESKRCYTYRRGDVSQTFKLSFDH